MRRLVSPPSNPCAGAVAVVGGAWPGGSGQPWSERRAAARRASRWCACRPPSRRPLDPGLATDATSVDVDLPALRGAGQLRRAGQRLRRAGPGLADVGGRPHLHLPAPRGAALERRPAGHGAGLRVRLEAQHRPEDRLRLRQRPLPDPERASASTPRAATPTTLGVRAVDDRTLVVQLEQPAAYFLRLASTWTLYPAAALGHRASTATAGPKPGNIVTNGPFKLECLAARPGADARPQRRLLGHRSRRCQRAIFKIFPDGGGGPDGHRLRGRRAGPGDDQLPPAARARSIASRTIRS